MTNKNQATNSDAGKSGKDTYIVKDGDTLESVAAENGMETVELMRLNPELESAGSNNNLLYTGQEIRLK